ncbi:hypothetical protein [Brevundimonas subvibrioides]|uniref:Uncharacterized protein n=1 Tax=Brevundimonas subvibrioides (strain ATCC 15264 / DSM 4735 / LMG 14903 / NBRC 16000 / CB 81) TaxID=633149 RepID=D9QGN7_BRESC|nr:hypothetical protein [Brevundimonas subvibrioides]ADL00853.1 conserved hypothetical protein [Brevundimonas subvibrioides ATCC 15264]
MSQTLNTTFATRRDAELAIERLVQEHGIERTDIFVAPEGAANSAGEDVSGSDQASAAPGQPQRNDGALNGRIEVSVDVGNDDDVAVIQAAFTEMGGQAAKG